MNVLSRCLLLGFVLCLALPASAQQVRINQNVSPRIARPVQVSFTLKHLELMGAEVGVRFLDGHLEAHVGTGMNLLPETNVCSGFSPSPICNKEGVVMWDIGLRWYPMYGSFSPYVSAGAMGPLNVSEAPVALIGAGIHWAGHQGLTVNLGADFALGQDDPARMVVPTLTVGYAF